MNRSVPIAPVRKSLLLPATPQLLGRRHASLHAWLARMRARLAMACTTWERVQAMAF